MLTRGLKGAITNIEREKKHQGYTMLGKIETPPDAKVRESVRKYVCM